MNELNLYEEDRININDKKFIQRIVIEKKYDNILCNFIMNDINTNSKIIWENENYFLSNEREKSTILFIEEIQSVFLPILNSFDSIIGDVKGCYCLDDTYKYKICEIFVEKYEEDITKEKYVDNYDIVVNIILNDDNVILFSDGIVSNMNIGDMIIYSSNTKYSRINLKNTPVYILVGLLKIYKKSNE